MEKLKIFAPIDGVIKKIQDIGDELFANKILGDGFYIEPVLEKINLLYPCFEKSKVSVLTDLGHAIYLKESMGPIVLMHIGLESNKYKMDTFKSKTKIDKIVSLNDPLIEFNGHWFKENNIDYKIPIVFDAAESQGWKINIIKLGNVKRGELIAELELIDDAMNKTNKLSNKEKNKNKFIDAAKIIMSAVGEKNFSSVYNCMTRTRLTIKNKDNVNQNKIKTLDIVKGITWAGDELQIIVGGDSYKLKDAIESLMNNSLDFELTKSGVKKGIWNKFLASCNGVISPLLPLLISVGLLQGISAIFVNTHLAQSAPPDGGVLIDLKPFSGILYILANTGLTFLAIFFCVSTVKYLKGDVIIGTLIAVSFASSFLITSFGAYGSWELFKIGDQSIAIQSYTNSLLPAVACAIFYVYFDKWVKKWMPGQVDIIFRPIIGYVITMVAMFVVIGPIFSIIQSGIVWLAEQFYKIPYGFGGGIFGFLWQPIVVSGSAWPIGIALDAQFFAGEGPLKAENIEDGAALALIGVILAMTIKTSNKKYRTDIIGVLPPLIFGVTEPAMYGITLPRWKPFIISCIGAGVTGFGMSLFDVSRTNYGGFGFLGCLGFTDMTDMTWYLIWSMIGMAVNFVITWFAFKELDSEKTLIKKDMKIIYRTLKARNIIKLTWKEFMENSNLNDIKKEITKDMNRIELFKIYNKICNLENKINILDAKFETKQSDIYTRINKIKTKNIEKYNQKMIDYNLLIEKNKSLISKFKNDLQSLSTKNLELTKLVQENINKNYNKVINYINEFIKIDNQLLVLNDLLFNSFYNLLIHTKYVNQKEVSWNKSDTYNTKNKWKLLVSL